MFDITNDSLTISSIEEKPDNNKIEEDKKILYFFINFFEIIGDNLIHRPAYFYREILEKINSKNIEEFYFCKNCNKSIIFYIEPKDLITLEKIYYSCDCDENKKEISFTNIEALKKYELNAIKKYLNCQEPGCNEPYSYFSIEDKKNFCKYHLEENLNINELNKFEEPSIYNKLKYLLKFILNMPNQNKNNKPTAEEVKKFKLENLLHIIRTTMKNYIKFPNINLYITIRNFYDSFLKYNESLEENNKKNHFEKIIEIIRDKNKLIHLNPKLYPLIKKLDLRQLKMYDSENGYIFNIINNLENLVDLDLSENCLYNIEFLINAKCKNLSVLKLKANYLNDENIKYFENLNFKELKSLNLECNLFTQYELFVVILKNFQKLEELNIGFNIFKEGKKKVIKIKEKI